MEKADESKAGDVKEPSRRKRGQVAAVRIGERRKRPRSKSSGASSTTDVTETESEVPSEIEIDVDLAFQESVIDLNTSDNFSETASEFYVDTDFEQGDTTSHSDHHGSGEKIHRRRKKSSKTNLSYRKKKYKSAHTETSRNDDGSDIGDVDVEIVSEEKSGPVEPLVVPESGQPVVESETVEEPDVSALDVQRKLILLLSNDWFVDVVQRTIVRVIYLNKSCIAGVAASLYWNVQDGNMGIFVHEKPIPMENKLYLSEVHPDVRNYGSVADYLFRISTRIQELHVCAGIKQHQNLWNLYNGFVDNTSSQNAPCYRSAQCLLLISEKGLVCKNCMECLGILNREAKRREVGDIENVPDKYLSKEELKQKKDKFKTLYKHEKQRADRLQKKVDQLQVKLDEALRDDLTSILRSNENKMTPLQKVFWESQRAAVSIPDKRGLRWHPMLIRVALHLHSLSPNAYEYIQGTKIMILPSKRRLFDYSHFINAEEGCQQEILMHIREKVKKCGPEDHFKYINLMFDEMHIRAGLVINHSTGELIGFTKLEDVEKELNELDNELKLKVFKPRLAKKVLVYMAEGITSNVKDIVAIFSTDDLSASQLFDRTWEVIYFLEDAGIKVLALTFDGAATNRKFVNMHESLDPKSEQVYCTKNLAAGDLRPLYFIVDPPHLLKTIRNALANSFSHRKSRKLWKNGEYLSWKVLEQVYELTKHDKFRQHKLSKAHVQLSSFSCMTVAYACQSLSKSVAESITRLSHHESMAEYDTVELVKFINIMNRFFDCVNGKEEPSNKNLPKEDSAATSYESNILSNTDLAAFTSPTDPRFDFLMEDFLLFFEDWKADIQMRPGIFTEKEKGQMIISHQALEAIQITVHGIIGAIKYMLVEAGAPSVCARVFNQDPLEQYFSKVRRKQGDNRNPSLKAVLDTRLNLHAQGLAALPSQKGNTSDKKRTLEFDDSPLPSRKTKKK